MLNITDVEALIAKSGVNRHLPTPLRVESEPRTPGSMQFDGVNLRITNGSYRVRVMLESQAREQVNKIVAQLRFAGVESKDLKTV